MELLIVSEQAPAAITEDNGSRVENEGLSEGRKQARDANHSFGGKGRNAKPAADCNNALKGIKRRNADNSYGWLDFINSGY